MATTIAGFSETSQLGETYEKALAHPLLEELEDGFLQLLADPRSTSITRALRTPLTPSGVTAGPLSRPPRATRWARGFTLRARLYLRRKPHALAWFGAERRLSAWYLAFQNALFPAL